MPDSAHDAGEGTQAVTGAGTVQRRPRASVPRSAGGQRDGAPLHETTYVRLTVGSLERPSGEPLADGAHLAQGCIDALEAPDAFPPRLFLLLATPGFQPFRPVLVGVRNRLADFGFAGVPLVGASVAVCLFDGMAHEEGAMLVCLASRFISARAGVAPEAKSDPAGAVARLLETLGITEERDVNPRGNRFLVTFLPGFDETGDPATFRAAEILEELRGQSFSRLPMFGGASSAAAPRGTGAQFHGDGVYTGAVAAALVSCDVSYGIGLAHGLADTGRVLRVKEVAEGGHIITRFWEGPPKAVMSGLPRVCLFGQLSPHGDALVSVPALINEHVHLSRPTSGDSSFHVLVPEANRILEATRQRVEWVMRRVHMRSSRVVGLLGIGCVASVVS